SRPGRTDSRAKSVALGTLVPTVVAVLAVAPGLVREDRAQDHGPDADRDTLGNLLAGTVPALMMIGIRWRAPVRTAIAAASVPVAGLGGAGHCGERAGAIRKRGDGFPDHGCWPPLARWRRWSGVSPVPENAPAILPSFLAPGP